MEIGADATKDKKMIPENANFIQGTQDQRLWRLNRADKSP